MKDSSEWVRQSMVDKAAKDVIAARGCTVAELKPYWVAKKLGVDPSGEIYDKVYDFQRRIEAECTASAVEVPVEAEAALRNGLEHFNAEVMAIFMRAVRSAGGAIDHAAGLRIADAEMRASRATSARVDVLALCRKAEADRDAAREQANQLRQELTEAQRREERLLGRIEQREIDATGGRAPDPDAVEPESGSLTTAQATVHAWGNGPSAGDMATEIGDEDTMTAMVVTEVLAATGTVSSEDQPPAFGTAPAPGGQVEMPLSAVDIDVQPDADGDKG